MHRLAEVPLYDLMLVNSVFCAAPGSPSARPVPGRIVCDSGRRLRAEPFQCLLATRQAFASRGFSDDELFTCNDPDELKAKKKIVVQYERALSDPAGCIDRIASGLSLTRRPGLVLFGEELGPGREVQGGTGRSWQRSQYYLGHEYMRMFDDELREFVNQEIDREVATMLGYDGVIRNGLA